MVRFQTWESDCFSPYRTDYLWGPPSLLQNGYRELIFQGCYVRSVKLTTHLHVGQSVWNVWWTERLQSLTFQVIIHLQPSVRRQYLLCSGRPVCQVEVDKRTMKLPGQPVCRLRMISGTSRHDQYISYLSLLQCVCIPTAHTHTHARA